MDHQIVSREQWLTARKAHLEKEKEFTRLRDELSRDRRSLPWTPVEEDYVFQTTAGDKSLSELFAERTQLLTYHFMYPTDWEEGCKSCSFLADSYDAAVIHLANRDVTMVTVSIAPLDKLLAFKQRMGWNFEWVSSAKNSFNRDYHVSFSDEERANNQAFYNYRQTTFPVSEGPGLSAFIKGDDGTVYHTYSSYGRGLDMFITTYHLLDTVAKGRDEQDLPYSMEWVRHHDRYE